ncbi:centrosome and spindle pole associated protein 1 [Chelmon rostratus]|uniref:centrosome and spindle pole associated protein 1 n=1 Tax=Chelmon rostratus TaxID=109905 RepID=UPI001BE922A5|nr:centrosome and spindle pole associated protein 1 [Chelmon rostratus]
MPPASATQEISPNPDRGWGLNLLLGTEYERKKNKLQQELQQDYKHYVATKKGLKTSEPHPQPKGLSLPIDEKISVQEKLREERNKEYNLFLQEQAQIRRLKRGTLPVTAKPEQVQASDASPLPILNTHTNIHPSLMERPASRRDAATLTETLDKGKRMGTWGTGHRGRRRWQLRRLKEPYSSEEELEFRHTRSQGRRTPDPEYKEKERTRECRANRAPQDIKEVAPGVHYQNSNECVWKTDLQMPDSMRTAARSKPVTSKDEAEFTTGLKIGAAEEQTASQMRKEQYKQELLKQISEQQRNRIREKKLELRVAATGATDPEKEFGAVNRQYDSWRRDVLYKPGMDLKALGKDLQGHARPKDDKPTADTEQRGPPGKSHTDHSAALSQLTGNSVPGSGTRAAQGAPLLDYFNEDYHRDFSNMLGELAFPRVTGVPPPPPPLPLTVTDNYKTPYDAAYYYHGTRNPLDPNLPYNQNGLPEGVQQSGNFHSPHQRPPPVRPSGCTEATDQHGSSPLGVGELAADKAKQRRESAQSYQEALREQIQEREECKRREKKEKERYDAKMEAEMMAYNPWGKSGGGAPIKGPEGNLVSDLSQMHRINKESYRNPVSRNNGQTQNFLMRNGHTPGAEARAPLLHRLSGQSDQPTQQLQMQDKYKEDLKQQIEENKRKQQEQRERLRIEEEKEEKRLAEQRACMQRAYEEEQRKQNKVQHRLESQIQKPNTQHQEEEKRVRQEEEAERKVPDPARASEEKRKRYEREPSPPVPTLQRKLANLATSRPSSVVSKLSSGTERTVSASHYRPVPVKMPQPQEGQQEVIRELSALRRYLRKEQRQLEAQLGQTDRQESYYTPPNRPRGRPRVDAFESVRQPAVQPSTRSPSSGAARVNKQNIRAFNQLKCRDTASREEVRHMYPDPPSDAQSLDIQQQALLREQQRRIRLMNREDEHDFLDQQLSHYHYRHKPGRYIHRDSMLPSGAVLIDVYGGGAREEHVHEQGPPQHSAEHQERTAPRRRHDYDVAASTDKRNRNVQPDAQSLQSVTSLNLKSKVKAHNQDRVRQSTGDRSSTSDGLPGDEVDVLSLSSALERRVSVETAATEPWLRPGTSDAVKRSGCRETPNSRMDAPPWLTHRVT